MCSEQYLAQKKCSNSSWKIMSVMATVLMLVVALKNYTCIILHLQLSHSW